MTRKKDDKPRMSLTRRGFLKVSMGAGGALMLPPWMAGSKALAAVASPSLDPTLIPKYLTPMLVPPEMPRTGTIKQRRGPNIDYYELAVRQFPQQVLPAGFTGPTTLWGYGNVAAQQNYGGKKGGTSGPSIFNAPSLTIEAKQGQPIRIKWINDLKDANGNFLPHLLPVDPTLHWANPPGGTKGRDMRPDFSGKSTPGPYTGPVPMVPHVHGHENVGEESDGYAEAWWLPAANDIPPGYATVGTKYDEFATKASSRFGVTWGTGYATFQYPNSQRASTIWYHDHTLGMTRLNVYAGPAGFWIVRGGPEGDNACIDTRDGTPAIFPGPRPGIGLGGMYGEIPIAIQDRSFNTDGSLFYPDSREFFDGITGPYIPSLTLDNVEPGFSPIWNPEFFGNTMYVNGNTWPFQTVEQRRYRFRFLNGCQSRFLILDFNQIPGVEVWMIGNEGGFLAAPVNITANHNNQLLMALAERADVIVDFTNVPVGNYVLGNVGPDEPFGGGIPGVDFQFADPATTGQIMQFQVGPATIADPSTPPAFLGLPAIAALGAPKTTRPLALIEKMGEGYEDMGPVEALLGRVVSGEAVEEKWMAPTTENPAPGDTEIWEFYNTTGDAHPMHIHEVFFQVVNRQALVLDTNAEVDPTNVQVDTNLPARPPEPWENGWKDTVIAYPGEVTRVMMKFGTEEGLFVWHCHIVEHEDNEMMRPFRIKKA